MQESVLESDYVAWVCCISAQSCSPYPKQNDDGEVRKQFIYSHQFHVTVSLSVAKTTKVGNYIHHLGSGVTMLPFSWNVAMFHLKLRLQLEGVYNLSTTWL